LDRPEAVHIGVTSKEVLADIFAVHFPTGTIADLTWGKGAFWNGTALAERVVARLDKNPRYSANLKADCRQVPLRDQCVDVVVFDPPHKHAIGHNTTFGHKADFDHLPRQKDITGLVLATLPELKRIARKGCIIKLTDMVESGRYYPQHVYAIADAAECWRLMPYDLAILYSGVKRSVRADKVLHLQHTHSYFLVWKWGKK
jgi:hypothetical protein